MSSMSERMRLTVTAWVSSAFAKQGEVIELPFGAEDERGRAWTPVLLLPRVGGGVEKLRCGRCGDRVEHGWRLRAEGKTVRCRNCVELHDSHRDREKTCRRERGYG